MEKNVHEFEIKLDKEWKEALDKAFAKKVKDVKVDGFRKGTCPKDVYIKKFGIESLYMDAVDLAANDAFKKLMEDNKDLTPAIEPAIDVTGISDSNIIFKFTIVTRPEVKLGEYKNLGLKKETAKVTTKEVEEEIKTLQENMADLVAKDGKVENGDTAIIDFEGYVDGEKLEGGCAENFSLEIGSKSFIEGFEEGLVGKTAGEKVTLNLKFPENYKADLANKDVKFDVTINEIKTRNIPEINEDFFKDLGYDDVKTKEDLDKKVKEYLTEKKQKEIDDKFIDSALEAASKNLKVKVNEEIVDDEIHRMIHEFEHQIQSQGIDINQYYEITGVTHEQMHDKYKEEANKRILYRYLLEEVAKAEKIEFTEDEVKAEAKTLAENYGITVDELIKAYGTLDVVKYDMTMHKALEIIRDNN